MVMFLKNGIMSEKEPNRPSNRSEESNNSENEINQLIAALFQIYSQLQEWQQEMPDIPVLKDTLQMWIEYAGGQLAMAGADPQTGEKIGQFDERVAAHLKQMAKALRAQLKAVSKILVKMDVKLPESEPGNEAVGLIYARLKEKIVTLFKGANPQPQAA